MNHALLEGMRSSSSKTHSFGCTFALLEVCFCGREERIVRRIPSELRELSGRLAGAGGYGVSGFISSAVLVDQGLLLPSFVGVELLARILLYLPYSV